MTFCLSFYKEYQQLYCQHCRYSCPLDSISCHSYQAKVTQLHHGNGVSMLCLEEKGPTPKLWTKINLSLSKLIISGTCYSSRKLTYLLLPSLNRSSCLPWIDTKCFLCKSLTPVFSLPIISFHFRTWCSLCSLPIKPHDTMRSFPKYLQSVITNLSFSCQRGLLTSQSQNSSEDKEETHLFMKQPGHILSLSISFAFSLLRDLDVGWRLSFSDRWWRVIFHFAIKLTLSGARKRPFTWKVGVCIVHVCKQMEKEKKKKKLLSVLPAKHTHTFPFRLTYLVRQYDKAVLSTLLYLWYHQCLHMLIHDDCTVLEPRQ